MKKKKDVVGV